MRVIERTFGARPARPSMRPSASESSSGAWLSRVLLEIDDLQTSRLEPPTKSVLDYRGVHSIEPSEEGGGRREKEQGIMTVRKQERAVT